MRLVEHVARMGEKTNAYMYMVEKLQERDHLEYLGVGGRILLK